MGDLAGGSFESAAYAASANGNVIVGSGTTDAGTEAFRWTNGGSMISLGDLPGGPTDSVARAVSANGTRIVGGGHTSAANSVAFVWDSAGGMRDLRSVLISDFGLASEVAGWDLLAATGISADGSVVTGTGINPSGDFEAWRAEIDIAPILTGDYNGDGKVNTVDYVVWRNNEGSRNGLPNDPLGGEIGAAQYSQWVANFGASVGSGAVLPSAQVVSTSVPEPATMLLLCLPLVSLSFRTIGRKPVLAAKASDVAADFPRSTLLS